MNVREYLNQKSENGIESSIKTLEQLRDAINASEEWLTVAEDAIEANGWKSLTGSQYGICEDRSEWRSLQFNCNMEAEIVDMDYWRISGDDEVYYTLAQAQSRIQDMTASDRQSWNIWLAGETPCITHFIGEKEVEAVEIMFSDDYEEVTFGSAFAY